MSSLVLTLVTPKGIKFKDEIEMVSFYQDDGVRQIFPNHINAHGEIEKGKCYYMKGGIKYPFLTEQGIFTVKDGEITVLSHHITLELDKEDEPQGAEQAKKNYNEFIKNKLEIIKKSGIK